MLEGKIAYVGNFEPTYSTETHVAASLQGLGLEVVEVQENAVPIPAIERIVNDGCDLLLYTRTWGLMATTGKPCMAPFPTRQGLDLMSRLQIPTASWHLDLYAGLNRQSGLRDDPFWRTKYVFTPDGDPGSADFFAKQGISHQYLRPGVFAGECYIARRDPIYEADIAFVGSGSPTGDYHSEWPYRRTLLKFLVDTYGRRFKKHGWPPLNDGQPSVRGHALNRLYASTKIVIGDTLCLGPGTSPRPLFAHQGYWSDRVYETLGRGGFLIHPWIKGMDEEFEDRKHLVFYKYGDFHDLRSKIDHYLKADDEREAIRIAGHNLVKSSCTYTNRARQVLRCLAANEPSLAKWSEA